MKIGDQTLELCLEEVTELKNILVTILGDELKYTPFYPPLYPYAIYYNPGSVGTADPRTKIFMQYTTLV